MVTIHDQPDCRNAPRKEILRDFVVALAERDGEKIVLLVADNIVWTLVGERVLTGRDAVRRWVTSLPEVNGVVFGSLLTHGRGASVDGALGMVDGTHSGFCHVLRFTGAAKTAKILGVTSYVIITPIER